MNGPAHDHRCADFLERLSRYLDDDVPESERCAIERHLRDCPCCEEVLASLKFTVATCHEKGRPALPRDVRQRAKARVAELLRPGAAGQVPGPLKPAAPRLAWGKETDVPSPVSPRVVRHH